MPGKRITNPSLVETNYPEAVNNNAKLLLDWDGLVWARPILLKLVGNSWMQGSYDAVSWDNYIENDHNYLRVSTDGGDTWRIIDLTGNGTDHPPVTIGSPDGGLVISGNDTQILTLSPATTTTPGSLSATDKIRIDNIKWYDVDNVGAGAEIYKNSTLSGDDVTFHMKTLVSTDASVTFTENTDTIDLSATGAGGGETNTMINVGTDGVGVFYQKNGIQFEMRNIASQTDILTVTLDELVEGQQDIDLNIIEANIDHNVLGNFVPNEHIDHSTVSILTTEGITGGGDLTATRTLTLEFDGLTQQTTPLDSDLFAFYRNNGGEDEHFSINYAAFIDGVTEVHNTYYVPLTTSVLAGLGLSGGGTLDQDRTLYLDINGLPTVPYDANDYVAVYDTSGLTHGKVTLTDLIGELAVSITAGDGMDFTTITSTGDVTLGTPSTVTDSTTNLVSGTTHTHELTITQLISIADIDNSPVSGEYLKWNGSTWVTDDPAIGATSPGLPLNSIQFNSSNTFAGNDGLLYIPTTDTIYFDDTNASDGSKLVFGSSLATDPALFSAPSSNAFILSNFANGELGRYSQLVSNRTVLGAYVVASDYFLGIQDPNITAFDYLIKAQNSSSNDILLLDNLGQVYIPEMDSASTTSVVYFDPTTGKLTYGAAPSGSGGIATLIADSLSGLTVNGGNTSSASIIELDQNDNKLVSATPVISDYIGFYDVSTGLQSKTLISDLPGIQLQANGVYQEDLKLGNIFNINQGSNVTVTYNPTTNSYTIAAAVSGSLPEDGEDGQILTITEGVPAWIDPCTAIEDCITDIDPNTGNVNLIITRTDCEESTQLYATSFTSITTNLTAIKIVTVPTIGELQYNGVTVLANDELTVTLGTLQYDLFYITDSGTGSAYNDSFTFQLLYSSNSDYLSTANVQVGVNACVAESVCFGYLYNLYAVEDSRELTSSVEWSVPTRAQFDALLSYVGGAAVAGGKLKKEGTVFWDSPNTGAADEYGFEWIGGGFRTGGGLFTSMGVDGDFWASTDDRYFRAFSTTASVSSAFGTGIEYYGRSIRLVKDATGLADGVTTTYTGNDGKTYNAIVINELYWTTENLEETEYRNGDKIPNVTDNTTWANLTTGALCLYDSDANNACKLPLPTEIVDINYSFLYNWWAAIGDTDGDNVSNTSITSSDDWRVPEKYDDMNALVNTFLTANQGQKLKEVGSVHWVVGNNGTDDYGLSLRGSSTRSATTGTYSGIGTSCALWSDFEAASTTAYGCIFDDLTGAIATANGDKRTGRSIFLCKDAVGVSDGAVTTYEGNDGKIYKAVCIDEKYWTQQICETKYRDGTWIPGYDGGTYTPISNSAWIALTTGAMCAYDDDESNAINE